MAIPIKAVPVLNGEIAEAFVRQAEENERKPRRKPDMKRQAMAAEILRRSKEFVPSWMK